MSHRRTDDDMRKLDEWEKMMLRREAAQIANEAKIIRAALAKKLEQPGLLPGLRAHILKWDAEEAEREKEPEALENLLNKTQSKYQ